ncbi:uncharacterized protein LOC134193289 [Corticium candelabrum]|uniref:uncharacterized protein LOC134193289 n=1 Tax=Corticium candelabrum TaxID=121492 RepID=UPI002E26BAC8|nr:uncharacterized protein LOC134193289 [Corticium candelabrum]
MDNNFDMLVVVCNAPGFSRYNPIEHLWSPCSKWLAGVSLPSCLPGETVAPALQNVSYEERRTKEDQVFSNALDQLDIYWDGKFHDGFRVTSVGVKSGVSHAPTLTRYSQGDYENVKNMLKSSLRAIKADEVKMQLLEEWRYLVKHMDRRWGMVCFRKGSCRDDSCKCMTNGLSATSVNKVPCSDTWCLPPVTPDTDNPGHYLTYRQTLSALCISKPDQHLKDVMTDRCPRCRYVFTSQADQHRHIQLVHGGNRVLNEISGSEPVPKKSTYRCVVCSQEYHSKYQLQKHKNESGHTVGRGRPKKTNPASTCTQQPG